MDDEWLEAALAEKYPDEVWFSAAELVAKTSVVLGGAPSDARGRSVEAGTASVLAERTPGRTPASRPVAPYVTPDDAALLEAIEEERVLDWGALPSWPDGPPSGHGLGDALARCVGQLRRETRLWIDESAAMGAGQAMLWQLADGLALAAAERVAGARERAERVDERDDDSPELLVVVITRSPPAQLAVAAIARHAGVDQGLLHLGPRMARDRGRWSPFTIGAAFLRARESAAELERTGRSAHLRWICEHDDALDPVTLVEAIAADVAERIVATGAAPWLVVCWDGLASSGDVERAAELHACLRAHSLLRRHAVVAVARAAAASFVGDEQAVDDPGQRGAVAEHRRAEQVRLGRAFRGGFGTKLELAWAGTRADEDARVRLLARVSLRESGRGQEVFAGEYPLAWWPALCRVEPAEGREP